MRSNTHSLERRRSNCTEHKHPSAKAKAAPACRHCWNEHMLGSEGPVNRTNSYTKDVFPLVSKAALYLDP